MIIKRQKEYADWEGKALKEIYKKTNFLKNPEKLKMKSARDIYRFIKMAEDHVKLTGGNSKGVDIENAKTFLNNIGLHESAENVERYVNKYGNLKAIKRLKRMHNKGISLGGKEQITPKARRRIAWNATDQHTLANNQYDTENAQYMQLGPVNNVLGPENGPTQRLRKSKNIPWYGNKKPSEPPLFHYNYENLNSCTPGRLNSCYVDTQPHNPKEGLFVHPQKPLHEFTHARLHAGDGGVDFRLADLNAEKQGDVLGKDLLTLANENHANAGANAQAKLFLPPYAVKSTRKIGYHGFNTYFQDSVKDLMSQYGKL